MQNYELGRELGRGNFGVTYLARHLPTGDLAAVKMIERGGGRIDANVERELLNQRALSGVSPFVVAFREAFLTPTHLCIAMEYVPGGEVFARVASKGRLSEREARRLFRQLASGVAACHALGVAHRDLKLENTLLTAAAAEGEDESTQTLKIADFGYSKMVAGGRGGGGATGGGGFGVGGGGFGAISEAKSRVGTPAYIAPEILTAGAGGTYDGRMADVWSLGVFLFVLVVGAYPFEPPPRPGQQQRQQQQQRDVVGVVRRILSGQYAIPDGLPLSPACADLISRLLVVDPAKRLPLAAVRAHPWFVGAVTGGGGGGGGGGEAPDPLPADVAEDPAVAVARRLAQQQQTTPKMQTEAQIRALLEEARRPAAVVAVASCAVAEGGDGGK